MTKPNERTKGLITLNYVFQADDNFYIQSTKYKLGSARWVGYILIGGGIYVGYPFDIEIFKSGEISLSLLLLVPGLLFLAFGLFGKRKHQRIILDRQNGIITYPDISFRKPLTGQFKDLKVIFSVTGGEGYDTQEDLKFVNTFRPRLIAGNRTVAFGDPDVAWSFYVWYMDKNRPLPLGDIFDDYRQQDYERRKAAGFPKPLYPSNIPTPEATPEQQRERERIGGW